MRRPLAAYALLCSAWIAPALLARQTGHADFVPPWNRVDWTVATAGAFGRATVGRLGVTGGPSVIVMDGSTALCVLSPATQSTMWALAGPLNDAAFVPNGVEPGVDLLAVVDAAGLSLRSYDPKDLDDRFDSKAFAYAPFAGAALVRSSDLDGDGQSDLLVVGADRRTVTPVLRTVPSWSVMTPLTLPVGHEILDVAGVAWNGGASREIAVCSEYGLEIFDVHLVRLSYVRCYYADTRMAVLRELGGPTPSVERVALVYRTQNGSKQRLGVYSAFEADEDVGLFKVGEPPIEIVGVASGDRDGDGDDDLLIAHQAAHDLRLLINQRGAQSGGSFTTQPSFDYEPFTSGVTESLAIGDPEVPMVGNAAQPILEDIDEDGLADAFTPISDAEFVVLDPAVPPPHPAGAPQPPSISGHPIFWEATFWLDTPGTPNVDEVQIDVELNDPYGYFAPPVDDLELKLWFQAAGATTVQSVAVRHVVYVDPQPLEPGGGTYKISFTLPTPAFPASDGFADRYFLTLAWVEWDAAAQAVVQTKRAFSAGLTAEFQQTPSTSYLVSLPGAWSNTVSVLQGVAPDFGGVLLGGYVPQTRIPPFDMLVAPSVPPVAVVQGNGPVTPGS